MSEVAAVTPAILLTPSVSLSLPLPSPLSPPLFVSLPFLLHFDRCQLSRPLADDPLLPALKSIPRLRSEGTAPFFFACDREETAQEPHNKLQSLTRFAAMRRV